MGTEPAPPLPPAIDVDLASASFEDGKLVTRIVVRLESTAPLRVTAIRLAEAAPGKDGEVVVLGAVEAPGVELEKGKAWEGRFAWDAAASGRVRALGKAMVLVVSDGAKPVAVAFDVAPPPVGTRSATPAGASRWRWVPLGALLAIVGALLVARSCAG
jgi:hypothetical protein